jgi:hypothetical protein
MAFLDDLKTYLTAKGYGNIFRDTMPDEPDECIGLFVWNHVGRWRYVQVQVRRMDGDDAYAAAFAIYTLLDSGLNETAIALTATRQCIARPRRGPKKLSDDGRRVVYYTEIAIRCKKNEP